MQFCPLFPGHHPRRYKLELGADHVACYSLAEELAPVASGLTVIHDEYVTNQFARYAESKFFAFNFSSIHDARKTKWSPCDGDFFAANIVIDYFVVAEKWY